MCISNLKNVAMQQDHTRTYYRVCEKTAETICIGEVAEVEKFGTDREGFTGKCKADVRCRAARNWDKRILIRIIFDVEYKITGVIAWVFGIVSRLGVGNGFVELGNTCRVTSQEWCTGVDDGRNILKDLLAIDKNGIHVDRPEALSKEKSVK
jgi:hypothetical protein